MKEQKSSRGVAVMSVGRWLGGLQLSGLERNEEGGKVLNLVGKALRDT